MLGTLIEIHNQVIVNTPSNVFLRHLYNKVNWDSQAICLIGARGVGKTTVMCQYFRDKYKTAEDCLYISADNINVLSAGLFAIAQEYFKYGGKALLIDEVHKYPDWAIEIKNIIDTYKNKQIIFSGSSIVDLHRSKIDLSRRVVYYELAGLSFREFLFSQNILKIEPYSLTELITNHIKLAEQFKTVPVLKYFRDYLRYGYYPFFLEGATTYLHKVTNIIEKVIFEDIAVIYNLKQTTLPTLKKLLWLIATSNGLVPNIEKISSSLSVSREVIYNCLEYLAMSGLITGLHYDAKGKKLVRKPNKLYLENPNLLYAINGALMIESDIGNIRETFFVNQLSQNYRINLHDSGDFIIDGKFIFEVGGASKTNKQIKGVSNSYLALDGIDIGFNNRIPLYLFGLFY